MHKSRAMSGKTIQNNAQIKHLRNVADWLDSQFAIPGTSIRFGLDSLIGLVPGVGDSLTTIASLYIMAKGYQLGVSIPTMLKMGLNSLIDLAVGAVPLVGDIFDIGFKANKRNVALIEKDLTGNRGRSLS